MVNGLQLKKSKFKLYVKGKNVLVSMDILNTLPPLVGDIIMALEKF